MAIERKVLSNGDVKYLARFIKTIDGKRKRTSKTFKKKGDAAKWLAVMNAEKVESQILNNKKIEKKEVNFTEFTEKWLAERSIRVTEGTLKEYRSKIDNKIAPFIGEDTPINNVTLERLNELLVHLKAFDLGPKTMNMYITLIKQIFSDAYLKKYTSEDESKSLKLLKVDEREFDYWEMDEITDFTRRSIEWEHFDFALLALNTGMRIGELSALRPKDIDFNKNIIRVTRTVKKNLSFGPTKGKVNRSVPITKAARKILRKRVKGLGNDNLIFTIKGRVTNVSKFTDRYWRPFQVKMQFKSVIRFHDLRHTFASHFMMNDGNIFTLQKILGHSDLKDTMKYAHLSPSHLQDAVGIINFE